MKTLRARLLRSLTLTLVLVFLVLWVLLVLGIRRTSEAQMLMHLEHDGGAVMEAIRSGPAGPDRLEVGAVEPVYGQVGSGHYYLVQVDGRERFRSASLEDFVLDARGAPAPSDHYRTEGPRGQSLIVLTQTRQLQGHRVDVFVAEDVSATDRDIWRLSGWALGLFLAVLSGALLLQGLAVGRALRPLTAVRDQLREVGAGRHSQISGQVPLEIKPLVDELNRLLLLMQRRLDQSRASVGNLAHALKTPLSVLFRTAEDEGLPGEVREQLRIHAAAIRERIERELRRARLAGPTAPGAGAMFNPGADLPVLVQVLRGIHREQALDIRLDAPDVLLPFDREDLLELIGNLADNACKWARTQVRLAVAQVEGGWAIVVCDDGPGCSPEQAQAIAGRGVRLDESKAGHGLGLAIVRDIVDFYGGRLEIGRDPQLHGLRVEAVLPLPSAPAEP